jgi:hypothetical protein
MGWPAGAVGVGLIITQTGILLLLRREQSFYYHYYVRISYCLNTDSVHRKINLSAGSSRNPTVATSVIIGL